MPERITRRLFQQPAKARTLLRRSPQCLGQRRDFIQQSWLLREFPGEALISSAWACEKLPDPCDGHRLRLFLRFDIAPRTLCGCQSKMAASSSTVATLGTPQHPLELLHLRLTCFSGTCNLRFWLCLHVRTPSGPPHACMRAMGAISSAKELMQLRRRGAVDPRIALARHPWMGRAVCAEAFQAREAIMLWRSCLLLDHRSAEPRRNRDL